MRNLKRLAATFIIITIMSFLCVGCGTESTEVDLAVVVGRRSNNPSISVASPVINDAVYNCCYTHGSVSFITVDGNPQLIYSVQVPESSIKGLSESKQKQIAQGYKNDILTSLKNIEPIEPEADVLKAISLAATSISGNSDADKALIIMDNGISTFGYVNFVNGLFYVETDEIVEELKNAKAIPDFSGVDVYWMYIGQTSLPQQELSELQKYKLIEIWEAILMEGGANSVTFTNDIATGEYCSEMPAVSVVEAENREIPIKAEAVKTEMDDEVTTPIQTVVLDNTDVNFIGDKAEFVNPAKAKGNLKQYADMLLAHPDNQVYVIGTTATGDRNFCEQLSKDRAKVVCDVLIEYGVDSGRLFAIGLGYDDPWHIEDLDENGCQIEELARQNRKVLIIDANGPDATLIK